MSSLLSDLSDYASTIAAKRTGSVAAGAPESAPQKLWLDRHALPRLSLLSEN
jgi:hypothetical protein